MSKKIERVRKVEVAHLRRSSVEIMDLFIDLHLQVEQLLPQQQMYLVQLLIIVLLKETIHLLV